MDEIENIKDGLSDWIIWISSKIWFNDRFINGVGIKKRNHRMDVEVEEMNRMNNNQEMNYNFNRIMNISIIKGSK
jgi:hypothetical protein